MTFTLQFARLQLLVGELLKLLQRLVHHALGLPFVVEETDGVEDDERANIAGLHHFIEVAGAPPKGLRKHHPV